MEDLLEITLKALNLAIKQSTSDQKALTHAYELIRREQCLLKQKTIHTQN